MNIEELKKLKGIAESILNGTFDSSKENLQELEIRAKILETKVRELRAQLGSAYVLDDLNKSIEKKENNS